MYQLLYFLMSGSLKQNPIFTFTAGCTPINPFYDVFLCVKTKDNLGKFSC